MGRCCWGVWKNVVGGAGRCRREYGEVRGGVLEGMSEDVVRSLGRWFEG